MENLSELEKILGYEFKNKHLLQQAVTHSSHTARLSENYERLEFLGDRVLGGFDCQFVIPDVSE